MNTAEKFAVVTGASSGIGWHISVELARRGYSILAVSNQPRRLDSLKQELESSYSVGVSPMVLDLAETSAAETIFEYCQDNRLPIEVLVNNAGILVHGEAVDVGVEEAKAVLQLHMNTPAVLCRLFGAEMVENQKGFILNVSSISSVMAYPTISFYGPTKTFLRQFSRALGLEMKGTGVTVSCLLPGATATDLYDREKVNIPLAKRLGVMKEPDKVARAGVNALFQNRAECVPGLLNKFIMIIIPIVPKGLIGFIHRKTRKRRPS